MNIARAEIVLRPATPADEPFLLAVYASTRADELAVTGWSDEQKAAFCRMQFEAQHAHYRAHYPGATYDVIEVAGVAVGRLYVVRGPKEILTLDIALLREHRGRGIGTCLLRELQEEARGTGKSLNVHVESFNPARRLYARLGFEEVEDKGVYLLMRWCAAS